MQDKTEQQPNEHVYFVNQLYRDFLLPEILGDDTATILYWAGKRISRHYDLESFKDVVEFFQMAEFGKLSKVKERRSAITFELSGQAISDRLETGSKEFSLESGMIAEAIQKETGRSTEGEINVLTREKKVQIVARF